jgi:hypothetical protein
MAAQGYYNSAYNNPPAYEHPDHATDPFNRVSPRPSPAGYNAGPYQQTPDSDPHHSRYSQQSIGSDNGAYVAGGRMNEHDQYSENIPLKSPNPYSNDHPYANEPQNNWMQQPTHYAPDPGMMEPQAPRAHRQKQPFWKKKIAYVTYILTVAQIIVFIVELVKSGRFSGISGNANARTSANGLTCRATYRNARSDQASV